MRILVLAPHPFFQNRGTPIDVLLILKVLVERKKTKVDLLVYSEGDDISLKNLTIYRTPNLKYLSNIRPGFSIKKVFLDFLMFATAWRLVNRNHYDLIHAGEESVFMSIFFKYLYSIPYAYDLDSSIAQQLVEKVPRLKAFSGIFNRMEGYAIKNSIVNLPVCNALYELCFEKGSKKTVTIHDISQLKNPNAVSTGKLKEAFNIKGLALLYIGNLEKYQGIDLLIESFALACKKNRNIDLVIIGGLNEDIKYYKKMTKRYGIEQKVHFTGPKPFDRLDEFLAEADILVAPRIFGVNTPMKVFPYLHSGKPVLLTDLYTHSQIITEKEAFLAPAEPEGFSKGILQLAGDPELRKKLGENGKKFVEKNHTFQAHQKRVNSVYDWIEKRLKDKDI